jgi:uncharacterized protein YdeI (YjbR/CyaY-like superfamily)
MRPAGLNEIERAKRDGRWDAAYDSASKSVVPSDFSVTENYTKLPVAAGSCGPTPTAQWR